MEYKHEIKDICYVCGFKFVNFFPWDKDGEHPQYGEFCPSCGCEFGYNDATVAAIKAQREKWMANSMKWWDEKENLNKKPENWDPQQQMKNIPEEYKI